MHRRPVHSKRNNRLNVLIAGSGGCGKSTLVNALCGGHEVANTTEWLDANAQQAAQPRPLRLRTYTEDMADPHLGSVTLRLVETQGLGDNINNEQHIADVLKYIEGQYDEVLAEESRIKRNPRFTDNRLHCVIYMIEATGHGLREQDIRFMRSVGEIANVVPVLAKADALTPAEVLTNKRLVYEDIEYYKIPIYQFLSAEALEQEPETEEDAERIAEMRRLQEALPLAIVASSKSVHLGDRTALAREYPWGALLIDDPKVSDFGLLREILLYSFMEELKETTNDILYEKYRTKRLSMDPEFNAAVSAAAAPTTASRANLAGILKGQPDHNPYGGSQRISSGSVPSAGPSAGPSAARSAVPSVVPSAGAGPGPVPGGYGEYEPRMRTASGHEYVNRENRLFEEEQLLHRDEQLVQNELELRRQELRRRELELQRLEEKLKKESQQLTEQQMMRPSESLQQRMDKLRD